MFEIAQDALLISRRAALMGVGALAVMRMPSLKTVADVFSAGASNAYGAVLYDMPYLNRHQDFAYLPAVGLVGGQAVAELDEATYRSHHVYV